MYNIYNHIRKSAQMPQNISPVKSGPIIFGDEYTVVNDKLTWAHTLYSNIERVCNHVKLKLLLSNFIAYDRLHTSWRTNSTYDHVFKLFYISCLVTVITISFLKYFIKIKHPVTL